jgi:glucose/arabinose dehydrogenase
MNSDLGSACAVALIASASIVLSGRAQQPSDGPAAPVRIGGTPTVVVTEDQMRLRVVPVAEGLSHPWGMAFLPDGRNFLVTERPGRLRLVRNDLLDPVPISGVPAVDSRFYGGLNDVAIHPQFLKNQLVYLTYSKIEPRGSTVAVARGRLVGHALLDVRDIFIADAWVRPDTEVANGSSYAGRMAFGPDGMLYVTVGDRDPLVATSDPSIRMRAQSLTNHAGKVLRLRDDGTPPPDNPFIGRSDAKPEIYTYGHRNAYGLAFHPRTGQLFECEFGPLGGDEINVLLPGRNYGWPLVSLGRDYTGDPVSDQPWWRPGMEMPVYFWSPSFNPSAILFYTGNRFPTWRLQLIVSGLRGGQLQRFSFNQKGRISGRPQLMLGQIRQRFRNVAQSLDGYLYVLTEGRIIGNEDVDGTVLRVEPAERE